MRNQESNRLTADRQSTHRIPPSPFAIDSEASNTLA
ncbi:hypothetical protein MalM25_35950 [Planctomycetes bacterium MalM25]|nr:hypothetical protein MalM25_35950 [Planctomycetes bacterium MalM25]